MPTSCRFLKVVTLCGIWELRRVKCICWWCHQLVGKIACTTNLVVSASYPFQHFLKYQATMPTSILFLATHMISSTHNKLFDLWNKLMKSVVLVRVWKRPRYNEAFRLWTTCMLADKASRVRTCTFITSEVNFRESQNVDLKRWIQEPLLSSCL